MFILRVYQLIWTIFHKFENCQFLLQIKDKSKSGKTDVDQEEGPVTVMNGSNHHQKDDGSEMVNDSNINSSTFDLSMKDETQPLKKAKNTAGGICSPPDVDVDDCRLLFSAFWFLLNHI